MNLTAETIEKQALRKNAVQHAYEVEVACKPIVKIQRTTKTKIQATSKHLEALNERLQKLEALKATQTEELQLKTVQNAINEVLERKQKVTQDLENLQKSYEVAYKNAQDAIANAVRVRFETLSVMTSKKKMKATGYLEETCRRLNLDVNKILNPNA